MFAGVSLPIILPTRLLTSWDSTEEDIFLLSRTAAMSPLNTSSGTAAVPLFLLSVSAYAFAPLRVLNGYFLSFFGLFLHLTAVGILRQLFFP